MFSLSKIAAVNEKKLVLLHPQVARYVRVLIARCYERKVQVLVTQGYRTIEEQNTLYALGRTKPGKIVTNAKGGQSFHNYKLAFDIALYTLDGKRVHWDTKLDSDGDKKADWMEVVEEAKKLGFEWAGNWTGFKEQAHFQMTFGYTLKELQAGKYPKGL